MTDFTLCQVADTISRNRHPAMSLCANSSVRHNQMEYMTPAIRIALRTIVTILAISRMESCQSCLGSYALAVSLAAVEREH